MKNYILLLVVCLLLASCKKENKDTVIDLTKYSVKSFTTLNNSLNLGKQKLLTVKIVTAK